MDILLPYLISLMTGYLLIDLLLGGRYTLDFYTHIFLAGGLGLGISAQFLFYSYLLFNQLNRTFSFALSLGVLIILFLLKLIQWRKKDSPLFDRRQADLKNSLFILAIIVLSLPLWMEAMAYPHGGWDAWSVWNLKAKFLLLGGQDWQNMLKPDMWRSSPHYPLLLPLINVWGWAFSDNPDYLVPLLTGFIFTFFLAGLLFSAIKTVTKSSLGILAVSVMLTITFYLQVAASQYADIVVSYFILGALFLLVNAKREQSPPFALLAGACLGCLSFVKGEGNVASLIIAFWACPYLFLKGNGRSLKIAGYFLAGLIVSYLPTILFQIFYAPANQTFINGLTSTEHPATLSRLAVVAMALPLELVSGKWNGIWLLLAAGLFLGRKRCFDPVIRIVPLFMAFYILAVLAFYFINTRWEIVWFISSSLNRITFSILPAALFWVFYGLGADQTEEIKDA